MVGLRERHGHCLIKVSQTQSNLIDGLVNTGLGEIHIWILIIGIEEYGDILVLGKHENNWMFRLREQSHSGTQHMSITRHPLIWNLTFGIEEYNERLILVNYGQNQTIGFRKMRGQNLVKVSQTRLNLIDGPVTTGLGEIHIPSLIIRIEEYGDTLVLVKFKTNWIARLREQIHTGAQHMSITHHP